MTHVHVVTVDAGSDTILGRLIRPLIRELGWSYGERANAEADVNYYAPYLQFKGKVGPTVAWFTHLDLGRAAKVQAWQVADRDVDYRIVNAVKYTEELTEPYTVIRPPIELDKFIPRTGGHVKGVVGTSGFVYPGGRKGERAYARLIVDPVLSQRAKFVAAGRGWLGVRSVNHPWERMQEFYQLLSLYVCTSLVEGTGHGPLEALACGVPVVVPTDVGVFDELGDSLAVTRYKAGDYQALRGAVLAALRVTKSVDLKEEARSLVEGFTLEGWLDGHTAVMAGVLGQELPKSFEVTTVVPKSKKVVADRGVYVVAFGEQARACAKRCINSWHLHMPGVPVALASNAPLGPEDVFVQAPDADIGGRSVKTQAYKLAPSKWDYVLYVDADTELFAPVPFLFQVLEDGWDMLICLNAVKFVVASNMRRPDNLPECDATFQLYGTEELLQFNGGVFGFRRNERTEALVNDWHAEWDHWGKRDQAALLRALHKHPVKLVTLGVEWNTVTRYYSKERSAGVLHFPMTARRWAGIIHGRSDSEEAWARAR